MGERTFCMPPQVLHLPVEARRRDAEGGEIEGTSTEYVNASGGGQQEAQPQRPRRDVPTDRGMQTQFASPTFLHIPVCLRFCAPREEGVDSR